MEPYKTTPEELIHDVLNYYGVKASYDDAFMFLETEKHPTPGYFCDWLEKKTGSRKL